MVVTWREVDQTTVLTAAVIGIFITRLETIHLNSTCLAGKGSSCWWIAGGLLVGRLVGSLFVFFWSSLDFLID